VESDGDVEDRDEDAVDPDDLRFFGNCGALISNLSFGVFSWFWDGGGKPASFFVPFCRHKLPSVVAMILLVFSLVLLGGTT
jgi:hypothetical protein